MRRKISFNVINELSRRFYRRFTIAIDSLSATLTVRERRQQFELLPMDFSGTTSINKFSSSHFPTQTDSWDRMMDARFMMPSVITRFSAAYGKTATISKRWWLKLMINLDFWAINGWQHVRHARFGKSATLSSFGTIRHRLLSAASSHRTTTWGWSTLKTLIIITVSFWLPQAEAFS